MSRFNTKNDCGEGGGQKYEVEEVRNRRSKKFDWMGLVISGNDVCSSSPLIDINLKP